MGLPCVNTTCSITPTVDEDGKLNLDTNLATNGGIVCDSGLKVLIDDEDTCNQLLTLGAAGLSALRPKAQVNVPAASRVAFPLSGVANPTVASSSFFVNNQKACDLLMIVSVEWQYQFTTDDGTPWSTSGALVLNVGGTEHTFPFEMSGTGDFDTDIHRDSKSWTYIGILPASTSIEVQTYGRDRTEEGGSSHGTGDQNGLTAGCRVVVMELDAITSPDLFTVS